MSVGFISLVSSKMEVSEALKRSEKIKEWLVRTGIINATASDCILSNNLGYAPGVNYRDVLEDRDALNQVGDTSVNGLEIVTTRNVFHNGGNGLEYVICPSCQFNALDSDWGEVADQWVNGGKGLLQCPNCGNDALLSDYDFNAGEPGFIWAFSDLGLTFYNWPPTFKNDFLKEMEKYYSASIKIVYGKV